MVHNFRCKLLTWFTTPLISLKLYQQTLDFKKRVPMKISSHMVCISSILAPPPKMKLSCLSLHVSGDLVSLVRQSDNASLLIPLKRIIIHELKYVSFLEQRQYFPVLLKQKDEQTNHRKHYLEDIESENTSA